MLISVVVPTYNDEKTLAATLRSVLAQDHADLEVVAVNDGGHRPADYLGAQGSAVLSDPRLRIVDAPRNGGVSAARNIGMARTRGEAVLFLDADDLIAPDMLSFAAAHLVDPEVNIVHFRHDPRGSARIEAEGPPVAQVRDPALTRLDAEGFFRAYRVSSGRFIPSVTVLRRAVLTGVATGNSEGPWREGMSQNEDCLLFMTLALRHDVHLSDETVAVYRQRDDGLSADGEASWLGRIEAMDLLLDLPEVRARDTLLKIVTAMRQHAARRVAGLLRDAGQRDRARSILRRDLARRPSRKSAVSDLGQALRR